MTKKDEVKFYKEIKPFIEKELSFVVVDADRGHGVSGGDRRYLIERDGETIHSLLQLAYLVEVKQFILYCN